MPSWPSSTRPDVTDVPTALVTGIAGQDGAYLTRQLLERGYTVVGLVQPGTALDPAVVPFLEGADLREGDLQDRESLAVTVDDTDPDEVYNLAGLSSVSASWDDPITVADVNALGVLRLVDVLVAHARATGRRPRLLQASSAEIFGAHDGTCDEDTPIRPRNPYAVSKAFAHEIVATYRMGCDLFASTAILFNHESPLRTTTFVSRKITRGVAGIALGLSTRLVLGDLDAQRDWGFAGDYTHAMWLALQHDHPGDYVVATGQARSVREFVDRAFAAVGVSDWGRHVESAPEFVRPTESRVVVGDAGRARRVLGWAPETTFDQLVEDMVRTDLAELTSTAAADVAETR
jgi:GDPmannose 4,6-dehydratase